MLELMRGHSALSGPWTAAEVEALVARDARHVWHPYAAIPAAGTIHPVVGADGVRLHLADGRVLIDGMSSWWAAIHGYNHPVLNEAIHAQLASMAHVMLGGLTHPPVVGLAERLVALTSEPLQHVFFSDSGSVAVEVAIKMALQYWVGMGRPAKQRLMTVRGGYHGDTFGAMALCDPETGMHHLFSGVLAPHLFAPLPEPAFGQPLDEEHVAGVEALITERADELAAVVIEPVVQGAGGMRFYSPEYLCRLRALCDEHQVLLIADEIATGFGRTGELFGCDHAGITPDVVCSIDLLTSMDWRAAISHIQGVLRDRLAPARELPGVADVRVLGAIGVIETTSPVPIEATQAVLIEHGVWLRPFGRLLYTMPPYITNDEDLDQIARAMLAAATRLT